MTILDEESAQLKESLPASRKAAAERISAEIIAEFLSACEHFQPMNSAHEGRGVMEEEFDELWDQIKIKQSKRDLFKMRSEAIQVAAMAMRFVYDIIDGGRGRV